MAHHPWILTLSTSALAEIVGRLTVYVLYNIPIPDEERHWYRECGVLEWPDVSRKS